ncbi:MAG: chloride channel protein [Acidipropionibacterium sp.]|nr:chloride channel protein [Acidipropionibacterium sp.]
MNHPHRSDTPPAPAEETPGGVIGFAAAAVLVGALTGLVTGSFTLVLKVAASVRNSLVRWGNGHSVPGLLLTMAACSAAAVVAAAVVRRIEPHAEGSGIPRTEAVVDGRIAPGSPLILPVKFLSGTLAIGAGLALGREGPVGSDGRQYRHHREPADPAQSGRPAPAGRRRGGRRPDDGLQRADRRRRLHP